MVQVLRKEHWFHPDGFPIVLERRDPQEPFPTHTHDFSELVIITAGRGSHVTGREHWPLAPGDVFVISGSRAHNYRDLDDLHLINVLFDPVKLHLDLHDLPSLAGYRALFTLEPAWRSRHQFKSRLHLCPKDLAFAVGLADQLDAELRGRQAGFAFLASAVFMQLIGFLCRCYTQSRNADQKSLLRVAQAIAHLESNYRAEINLDELAAIAHMPKRSFIRAFQAAMGASPIAYLIQLRINRAATLLRRGTASVTDIAFSVGFTDSNYFTRQFRKRLGVSPRTYRQQHGHVA